MRGREETTRFEWGERCDRVNEACLNQSRTYWFFKGETAGQVWERRRAGREDCRGRNAVGDWQGEVGEQRRTGV